MLNFECSSNVACDLADLDLVRRFPLLGLCSSMRMESGYSMVFTNLKIRLISEPSSLSFKLPPSL